MGKVNSSSISGASRIRAGQGICVLRQGILGHFRPLLYIFGAKGLFKDTFLFGGQEMYPPLDATLWPTPSIRYPQLRLVLRISTHFNFLRPPKITNFRWTSTPSLLIRPSLQLERVEYALYGWPFASPPPPYMLREKGLKVFWKSFYEGTTQSFNPIQGAGWHFQYSTLKFFESLIILWLLNASYMA